MKTKKLLCLLLALAMILSTMGVPAFANEASASLTTIAELKEAIENARDGDVIEIPAGKFDFSQESIKSVTIKTAITIKGAGKDASELIFDSDTSAILIESSGVTIEDLAIVQGTTNSNSFHISISKGAWDAPSVHYSDITLQRLSLVNSKYSMCITGENIVIDSCDFTNQNSDSILIYSVRGNTKITNNNFGKATGNNRSAIKIEGGVSTNLTEEQHNAFVGGGALTISGNKATEKGIFFMFNNWGLFEKLALNITDNTVDAFTNKAIVFYHEDTNNDEGETGKEFSSIDISENEFINLPDGKAVVKDQRIYASSLAIDATNNYWGSAEPDFSVLVPDGAVNMIPYYTNAEKSETNNGVADVNGKKYATIDKAIAAWTNGTTLTLLDDVEVSSKVQLQPNETHTLDLGEFTWTGPSSGTAFEIKAIANASSNALTINAGEKGRIKASTVIGTPFNANITCSPVITINGGIFDGKISHNDAKTKMTPVFKINDGTFNGNISLNRGKLIISGGTFNGGFSCSVTTTYYVHVKKGKFAKAAMMNGYFSELVSDKWTYGSEKGVFDSDIYVDEDGYFIVGDKEIAPEDFSAAYLFDFENLKFGGNGKSWQTSAYSTFYYSTIPTEYNNTLYFMNTEDAVTFNDYGTVILYDACNANISLNKSTTSADAYSENRPYVLNVIHGSYTGTIYMNRADNKFTIVTDINDESEYNVIPCEGTMLVVEETKDEEAGTKTLTYSSTTEVATADAHLATSDNKQYYFTTLQDAVNAAKTGETVTLLDDVTESVVIKATETASFSNDALTIDLNQKTLTGDITISANAIVKIENGNINNTDSSKSAVSNSGLTTLKGLNITSEGNAVTVEKGAVSILDGKYIAADSFDVVSVNNDAEAEISGGYFNQTFDKAYLADGYRLSQNASGYIVVPSEEITDSIYVMYQDVTPADATEEKVYGIVVKANKGDVINQLETVDLLFNLTGTPLDDGELTFTVRPAKDFTMSQTGNDGEENRYMFNYSGLYNADLDKVVWEGTAEAITVGYITVGGYGEYAISTNAEATTNIVNATTYEDSLVDFYTAAGANDNNSATGALFVNKDDIDGDEYVAAVNGKIEVPTYALTINIDFNNPVNKNVAAYQDMKVEIVGGVIDKELALGNEDYTEANVDYPVAVKQTEKGYVLTANLPYNTSYAVTVSGAGYRTAYCDNIKLTEAKTVQFWNNVMSDKNALEVLVGSGKKVTKNFLAGEVVKDGEINIYDLSAVVSYFGQTTDKTAYSKYAKYDLNRDGVIDSKDVAYVLVSWNE